MLVEKEAARKGLNAEIEDIKDELVVKKEMKLSNFKHKKAERG